MRPLAVLTALMAFSGGWTVRADARAGAQTGAQAGDPRTGPHPRFWVVDDAVWQVLDQDWSDTSVAQPERGYCVAYVIDSTLAAPTYHLWAVVRAPMESAGPMRSRFECPEGPGFARLHTHPVSTDWADGGPRRLGGPEANECFPSDMDRLSLVATGEPVGFVQCDRRAIVAYWPRVPR